jgi:hypothetical protein
LPSSTARTAALPTEGKTDLVASVVQQLDTSQQKQEAATAALGALSAADQEAVAANTGVLDHPDMITQRNLWYMVVATMAVAIFVFGIMVIRPGFRGGSIAWKAGWSHGTQPQVPPVPEALPARAA